jgi:hypothetical protein
MEWEEINIEKMAQCPACGSDLEILDDDTVLYCSNRKCKTRIFISDILPFISKYIGSKFPYDRYNIVWYVGEKIVRVFDAKTDQRLDFSCVFPFDITEEKLKTYILFSWSENNYGMGRDKY